MDIVEALFNFDINNITSYLGSKNSIRVDRISFTLIKMNLNDRIYNNVIIRIIIVRQSNELFGTTKIIHTGTYIDNISRFREGYGI